MCWAGWMCPLPINFTHHHTGEKSSGFLSDKTGNTSYRQRLNPVTGINFSDILVKGMGNHLPFFYRINEMPSIKCRIICTGSKWFPVRRSQTINMEYKSCCIDGNAFVCRAIEHSSNGAYTESESWRNYKYKDLVPSTGGLLPATNPIVLDYLRLVPFLKHSIIKVYSDRHVI